MNVILVQSELHHHEVELHNNLHYHNIDLDDDCFDCLFFNNFHKLFTFSKIISFSTQEESHNNYISKNLDIKELLLRINKSRAPPIDQII